MSNQESRHDVFLADIMCKRKGKKENIPTPPGYWNMPEWKVFFKQQILAANKLMKIYPFEVVSAAINNKKTNWIYSLHYPGLKQILLEENSRYERKLKRDIQNQEKMSKREEIVQTDTAPVIFDDENSLRNRLD